MIVAAFAAGLLFTTQAAPAEPIVQTVEEHRDDRGEIDRSGDSFVHRSSGFVFPALLAQMPARKTVTYGPGDAAVYYTLHGGGNGDAWIDVYVYPATLEPAAERRDVEQALVERFSGAAVANPVELPPAPEAALEGWYRGSIQGNTYLTGYRIVRAGNWYIKARISIPDAGGDAATKRAMDAIAAIPWEWREPAPIQNGGRQSQPWNDAA